MTAMVSMIAETLNDNRDSEIDFQKRSESLTQNGTEISKQ
jgi:hypothetical protein